MKTQQRTNFHEVASSIIYKIQNYFLYKLNPAQNPSLESLQITIDEILIIIREFILITKKQENLLNLMTQIKVVGDVQGHLPQLLMMIEYGGQPEHYRYLFLGNYISGGKYSFYTLLYLYCQKVMWPKNMYMLRGNNESLEMVQNQDFEKQCQNITNSQVFWKLIQSFTTLPLAAVVLNKVFCVHGGLSPEISQLEQINNKNYRFKNVVSEISGLRDLLWSDPMETIEGWDYNEARNISYYFGPSVVTEFLKRNNLKMMIRSHEFKENGYEVGSLQNILTVFSASNYLGKYQNSGAFIEISSLIECSFYQIKPQNEVQRKS